MNTKNARVHAGSNGRTLHDQRHCLITEATRLDLTVPVDGAEHRPFDNTCNPYPLPERPHGACERLQAIRYAYLAPLPLLVCLGAFERDRHAFTTEGNINHVDAHEFTTSNALAKP